MKLVTLNDRKFVVLFADDGSPRSIKERKDRGCGRVKDHTYWHQRHGPPARPSAIVNRVLSEAQRLPIPAGGSGNSREERTN